MGWLGKRIKQNGIAISDRYARTESYFDLTPAGRTLIDTLDPLIASHARGVVLDAGAGRLTYHPRLKAFSESVVSVDRDRVHPGLSAVADLEKLPFPKNSFDSVFCSQVLEHVPNPLSVLLEFSRTLRPGGKLILSVPHLAYLHNEPHDYYRYTEYGLRHLLGHAGLSIEELRWSGGLLSFLGHFPSTLLLNLSWGIPGVFQALFWINRGWSRLIGKIERKDLQQKRFALNLAVVAQKPESPFK